MNTFHHTGAERELFRQIARKEPSRPALEAISSLRRRVQFVLLATLTAGLLGAAVALGSSALGAG